VQPAAAHSSNTYGDALDVLTSALSRDHAEAPVGLIVVRIEDFWRLVTAEGYRDASQVMAELETRLRAGLRQKDFVLRLADGKFAAIISGVLNEGHLDLAANKILRIARDSADLTARLGIALSPPHADDADHLLRAAESALLVAEAHGHPFQLYNVQIEKEVSDRWAMELELDDALDNNVLDVYYQPKIAAREGRVIGAEALVRWFSPTRGQIRPDVFVALADQTGRIDQLTWYVMNVATRACMSWTDRRALSIAVNVTPNVIEVSDLPRLASNALGLWNLPPKCLVIELTESALMHSPQKSTAVLTELRQAGIKVAIDDFGTGYSSLSYFRNIPADELKIDKSFVLSMLEDDANQQLVRTIINLAHDFGLSVTAEGVENEETAALLTELECDYLQGFYFAQPLANEDFVAWLEAESCRSA
jgi:EAL domain-containing protein (putative c-di-GMP-specific phosphodiesterase class I)/GGDEF domain-containing protein